MCIILNLFFTFVFPLYVSASNYVKTPPASLFIPHLANKALGVYRNHLTRPSVCLSKGPVKCNSSVTDDSILMKPYRVAVYDRRMCMKEEEFHNQGR